MKYESSEYFPVTIVIFKVTEKGLCQKVQKTSHVGMHYPKTLPQKPMKQATMHTRRHAHITVQCIYRVATIPTSFQPHPPQLCICEM